MSSWAGSKGKQPTRALPPSGLRNEILAESTDDERAIDKETIQVPDSDTVIPETQLEDLGHDAGDDNRPETPNDGESEDPLSPTSFALLQRTKVSRSQIVAEPSTIKFLSKPTLGREQAASPPPFSFGQARKPVAKPTSKEGADPSHLPPMPVIPTNAEKRVDENGAQVDGAANEPEQDSLVHRDESQSAAESQKPTSLPRLEDGQGTLEIASHQPAELPLDVSGAVNRHPEVSLEHSGSAFSTPPPFTFPFKPRRYPAKRGEKIRRVKPCQQRSEVWPPRAAPGGYDTRQDEHPKNEEPILDVVAEVPESSHPPVGRDGCPDNDANLAIRHEDSITEDRAASPAAPLVQEETAGRDLNESGHQIDIQQHPHQQAHEDMDVPPQIAPQTGHPTLPAIPPSLSGRHRQSERVLHGISSYGEPSRINKPRRSARPVGSQLGFQASDSRRNASSSPLENDAILAFIRAALEAREQKSQDTVDSAAKAYETAIAAVNEKASYQHDLIEAQRVENSRLNEKCQKITTMQKYMKGIETDLNKIRRDAKVHQARCEKALREKVAEVEGEKEALIRDVTATIDTFERSQKSMKAVIDDCWVRIRISHSTNKSLAEQLGVQSALVEEEKKKRIDLEQQLLPSVQTMQRHIENSNATLIEKLGNLQTSVEDTASDEERDACLKQCLNALQKLQATPFLTAKDLQKAEGMLRFVNESIDSKLGDLSNSVEGNRIPVSDLQDYIREQLQSLRAEVLKYDEIAAEYHKAHRSNELLGGQLEAQKEQCGELEEQIRGYCQSETELKSRYSQLERELDDLRAKAHDLETEPSGLEQEMITLRHQLRKTEEDRLAKITELDQANQHTQAQTDELAKANQLAAAYRAKLIDTGKKLMESKKVPPQPMVNAAELRTNIEEQYRKIAKEKEVAFNDKLHRLTHERDEKMKLVVGLERELNATKDKLEAAQNTIDNSYSEMQKLREAKVHVEEELKKSQQIADQKPNLSAELAGLKEQLVRKGNALSEKERQCGDLHKDLRDLRNKLARQDDEKEQLRNQLAEAQSKIGELQDGVDGQAEQSEKHAAALQEERNQVSTLRNEKTDLESRLQRFLSNQSRLNDAQAEFSIQKNTLQAEISELRASKEAADQDLHRAQAKAAEELKTTKENFQDEVDELKRQLSECESARKATEENARRMLEDQKRKTEEKYQLLAREKAAQSQQHGRPDVIQHYPPQVQGSRPYPAPMEAHTDAMRKIHATKPRKKVHRQNKSVLDIPGTSHIEQSPALQYPGGASSQYIHGGQASKSSVPIDPALEELGTRERLDENGVSVLVPVQEIVPETQEMWKSGPAMPSHQFHEGLTQMSGIDKTSSSDLTEYPSDEFDILEQEASVVHAGETQALERISLEEPSCVPHIGTPSRRSVNHVAHSQDRPKSQANTGHRMMPPPQLSSFGEGSHMPSSATKPTQSRPSVSSREFAVAADRTSSPDFVHHPSSGGNQKTYGHHGGKLAIPNPSQRSDTPQLAGQTPTRTLRKRMSSTELPDDNTSSKKIRSSSQSLPYPMSQTSQRKMSHSPAIPSQVRGPMATAHRVSDSSRSRGSSSSKSGVMGSGTGSSAHAKRPKQNRGGMEDRFVQELGRHSVR